MHQLLLTGLLMVVASAPAAAQPDNASRGALLYATHCVECHTTQMHWRARRQVVDRTSLKEQVQRWQEEARLQWTEQDIEAVARYLDETIYRLPRPALVGSAIRR